MTSGIYCYINKDTNQVVYVGKDTNINENKRYKSHLHKSQRNQQPFNQVLQNNPQKYEYKVLKKGIFSDALLNALEIIYIKRYGTYENRKGHGKSYGFNFTIGGDGVTGFKHSKETRKQISKSLSGITRSKETRQKISQTRKKKYFGKNHNKYGTKQSIKTKEQISITESQSKTTSGFYRISKNKDNSCKNGFRWQYGYTINNKRKNLKSVNLLKLKEKILKKNLSWKIIDEEKAKQICKKYGYDYEDLK